jgi:myo-inositol 2-dehydrogenase/D-chiro-inositol 1-dehydrogenase
MDRLRLGCIGAGGFSSEFIHPQLELHQVDLVAVCDLDRGRAERARTRWGYTKSYQDFREMCDHERLDAVICIGGPQVHYQVGREILQRKIPLYVQKSPAPSSAETRDLAALAATQGVICHVGFNFRSSPMLLRARRFMESPGFGSANLGIVRYGLLSGGPTLRQTILDQHCHPLDIIRHLMGEVVEMHARWTRVGKACAYVATLQFASGAIGTLNATSEQIPRKEFTYFEVTGQSGHYLTCHDGILICRTPEDDIICQRGFYGGTLRSPGLDQFGYIEDIRNFLDSVRGKASSRSPISDAIGTMELCEELYSQLRAQGAEEALSVAKASS